MTNENKHYPEFKADWGKPATAVARVVLASAPVLALWVTRPFWTQLIIAATLAFFMRKTAVFLRERLRFHRGWAAMITTLLLLAILAIPIFLFPTAVKSMQNLSVLIADFITALIESIALFLLENDEIIIGGLVIDLSSISEPLTHQLNSGVEEQSGEAINKIITAVSTALTNARSLVSLTLTMFFIMSFTFYMLLDLTWLKRGILFVVPETQVKEFRRLAENLITIWKAYIRGQLGVMLAIGIIVTIAAWLIGLQNALALGLIAGLLEIIPNLGPILATIPAVITALFQGSYRFDIDNIFVAIIVIIVYLLIQKLEDTVLTPTIQGKAVELPPLVVIVSVLVGIHFMGLVGGIIAIPVVASTRELLYFLDAKTRMDMKQIVG